MDNPETLATWSTYVIGRRQKNYNKQTLTKANNISNTDPANSRLSGSCFV